MSPIALKVLSSAYDSYQKNRDFYVSIQPKNPSEWYDTVIGARQLAQSGYIDEVSDFVLSSPISADITIPITFNITELGIEYMRGKGEADH